MNGEPFHPSSTDHPPSTTPFVLDMLAKEDGKDGGSRMMDDGSRMMDDGVDDDQKRRSVAGGQYDANSGKKHTFVDFPEPLKVGTWMMDDG